MNRSIMDYGPLRCRVIDDLPSGASPKLLVVLCHGFGAPGDDLVDFGPFLLESNTVLRQRCRFVFPEAPIDLGPLGMPGGRAWWPINMARLAEISQTRDFGRLTQACPDGMQEASLQLATAVRAMQQSHDLDDTATVLGGFSQGAMVATDITLRHGFRPASLALFSGSLLCRDDWQAMAGEHPGCPVIQTHGTSDPVLPFAVGELLRDLLQAAGFDVQFSAFDGPHTIPLEVLSTVSQRLVSISGGQTVEI